MKVKIENLVSMWAGEMRQASEMVATKLIHAELEDDVIDILMDQLRDVISHATNVKKRLEECQEKA